MAYFSISATDARSGRRVCLGGSEDRTHIERYFAEDYRLDERDGYIDYAVHLDHDSFAHAIRVIEYGQTPEQARLELLARGY